MSETLDVPGARLAYDVTGHGEVVALVGLPMTAPSFADLADELAREHTVVRLDPRGFGRSTVDDPAADVEPRDIADDVAAVLAAVTSEPATVLGSSGGAISALELAVRHPARVRTVIAHEPPLLQALPDAAEQREIMHAVRAAYREHGPGPGFAAFGAVVSGAGLPPVDPTAPEPPFPTAQERADGERMLARNTVTVPGHELDLAALSSFVTGGGRVILGVGEDSAPGEVPRRATEALAASLGVAPIVFPGGHAGFVAAFGGAPADFAACVRAALSQNRSPS